MWAIPTGISSVLFKKKKKKSPSPESRVPETGSDPPIGSGWDSGRNKYNRISQCKTAKEIWIILEITHEGATQVEDSKVRILENDYEMFKMKPNEYIVEMFTRFTDVVNGLEGLGKRVSEQDKVSKILRCLPPKWNSKT